MFKKKIIVVAGLSPSEILAFADAVDSREIPLEILPLAEDHRPTKVGEIVEQALARESAAAPGDFDGDGLLTDWPVVFFAVYPRAEIDATINAFKSVVDRRAVYASLTPTNMVWLWSDLLEHLAEEHQFFVERERRQKPSDS